MGGCASRTSKSPETAAIHAIPMDERRRRLIKIVMMMRVDMRELLGMEVANRWGFWVDRYLSKKVRDFADWIEYPKGDRQLEGHSSGVSAVVVSDDGYFLFTGDYDGMIKVWNMLDNQIIREWNAHGRFVSSLAFQSGLLISGSWDNSITIWDTFCDYQLVHTLEGHRRRVMSVDINGKATQVISASEDKSIRIWSVKTGECISVLTGHSDWVISVNFIHHLILSGSGDTSLKVWNPSDGSEIQSVNEGILDTLSDVSINCDASLVAGAFQGGFSLFTWPELKYIREVHAYTDRCTFHPNHPNILAVNDDWKHSIHIFDLTNYDIIRTLEGHSQSIKDLCFTPNGSRLASVSDDQSAYIWDVSDL